MPNLPHLILPRAEYELPRRKVGFGGTPARDHRAHGRALAKDLEEVLTRFRTRQRPVGIDPRLILRVQLNSQATIDEDAWERCGLVVLSVDENKMLVLFSSDTELSAFKRRLTEYRQGPSPRRKSAPHQQIFASIDRIGEVRPEDRIGRLFRAEGITDPMKIDDDKVYVVDVELWDLGSQEANRETVAQIRRFIQQQGGRLTDYYVGDSLVLLRSRCSGKIVRDLLGVDYVAVVDLPPKTALSVSELLNVGLEDLPNVPPPPEDAPGIAVLDSGLTTAHPLIGPAVGEATAAPRSWRDAADGHGHGTMVAGVALYGNVEACIVSRSFAPQLTLYSARVLNDNCEFDDESLIISQMREAITYFHETYGCRVFNLSLGDSRLPYRGGKVSPWASILDTLARELDVVIVVSAGNYKYDPADGNSPDCHLQDYPQYLLGDAAKIIEPATGAIVLTVGSLAHVAHVPPGAAGNSVAFRPIAQVQQPSPFTRCGPSVGGAIKPELCEVGGNWAYDGITRTVHSCVQELSVVSMNRNYIERLFATGTGTSYAAPKVAHAAARLFESFPNASANLIRALLVASASVPDASERVLRPLGRKAVLYVCGYGRPDLELARASDEARVVLYAQSTLAFDKFHIYEVPIPHEFTDESGTRRITVVLAYDPPVRHTRLDYLGVKMSFRLIRGKSVQEVAEAFRLRGREEQKIQRLTSTRFDCPMEPSPTIREGGTLQKAVFTMKKPRSDYGDTYYLVVRCERKWAGEDHAPRRYAVVVVVEHSGNVNLYNSIRERVSARIRVRT